MEIIFFLVKNGQMKLSGVSIFSEYANSKYFKSDLVFVIVLVSYHITSISLVDIHGMESDGSLYSSIRFRQFLHNFMKACVGEF